MSFNLILLLLAQVFSSVIAQNMKLDYISPLDQSTLYLDGSSSLDVVVGTDPDQISVTGILQQECGGSKLGPDVNFTSYVTAFLVKPTSPTTCVIRAFGKGLFEKYTTVKYVPKPWPFPTVELAITAPKETSPPMSYMKGARLSFKYSLTNSELPIQPTRYAKLTCSNNPNSPQYFLATVATDNIISLAPDLYGICYFSFPNLPPYIEEVNSVQISVINSPFNGKFYPINGTEIQIFLFTVRAAPNSWRRQL